MAKGRGNAGRPRNEDPFVNRGLWEKWKREAADKEYASEAFKLINSAGKMKRQEYLEAMLVMDEKYPGRGWIQQMDELEAFYHKHGLALKEYPRMRTVGEIDAEVAKLVQKPPF